MGKGRVRTISRTIQACCLALLAVRVAASEFSVDKVYHPYIQPLERELEWRMLSGDGQQLHRLGIGKSLSDSLFVEGYLIAEDNDRHFSLEALELEVKWQLTEQGEYDADWGVLFELEHQQHDDTWGLSSGLLMEKEWGKWVGAANFIIEYEWGNEIKNELESSLVLQARYRYSEKLEPSIEFYSNENGQAVGPVVMGDIRLAHAKKMHWEVGSIFGLGYKGPDSTLRVLIEYEY